MYSSFFGTRPEVFRPLQVPPPKVYPSRNPVRHPLAINLPVSNSQERTSLLNPSDKEVCVSTTIPPGSSYPIDARFDQYVPSPLDELSYENGLRKFEHDQSYLTVEEKLYALKFLDTLYPMLYVNSQLATDEEVQEELLAHEDKTSGYPWRELGTPTKGEAVDAFGLDVIEKYYQDYTPVIHATLKDEIRLEGKDARLFRPADVSAYIEGVRLFKKQNDYLSSTLESPIFTKFVTPGTDVSDLFTHIKEHRGDKYCADGSRWDANFPMWAAELLAHWRSSRGKIDADRVFKYYSAMYCGWTCVDGHLVNLWGNPSGHFCTSIDNSLLNVILFAIHGYRSHLSISELIERVLFYTCGDDLIWSDRSSRFSPRNLDLTYSSLGCYLEFNSLEPLAYEQLIFVGMQPKDRDLLGDTHSLYSLVEGGRAYASFHIRKSKISDIDEFAKKVSIATLFFGNTKVFEELRSKALSYLEDCVNSKTICAQDRRVMGLCATLSDESLASQYLQLEHSHAPTLAVPMGAVKRGYHE